MPDIVIHVVASALYAGLALHFWYTRWRTQPPTSGGLQAWERSAILVALCLHGWLIWSTLALPEVPRFGFALALSSMLWVVVLIFWIENLFVNLEIILPVSLGLAALCVPLAVWFPGRVPATTSFEFRMHLLLVILAYGVLAAAMLYALLMAVLEQLLHRSRTQGTALAPGALLTGPLARLPPLLALERRLFMLIAVGFVLLTLTLATGMSLSDSLFGRALRFNHETLFAVVSWIVFAVLLAGRYFYGWRGRVATRWVLTGFIMVVLAGIGSRFVLEVILGRS
ncbi:MAG: cytochrome C biogenesis protein [Betaproteobacteria bacterium]|nr:cytochrome C biogenesis protein [Betaproteobacteria bacterium]